MKIAGARSVERALHRPYCERGQRRQSTGERQRLTFQLLLMYRLPGQSKLDQLAGLIVRPQQQHLARLGQADDSRQQGGHATGDEEVERHLGKKAFRSFGPDREITVQSPLETTADRPTVNGTHDRLTAKHDRSRRLLNGVNEVARSFLILRMDVLMAIIAGAEGTALAGKDDATGFLIPICILEGLRDIAYQLPVHGIQPRGPVQSDRPYTLFHERACPSTSSEAH